MAQARRRVSYVIPPPNEAAPRLKLPSHGAIRLGSTVPLLTPLNDRTEFRESRTRHPRHRLGVASLALDTSTTLLGKNGPQGILYSGGRDGLIISWDLGITTKKRRHTKPTRTGSWEVLTGWADNFIDEEGEDDDHVVTDGDVLGEVKRRRASSVGKRPYEQQWETDLTAFEPGTHSQFRQCAQAHSDWVNDILLCNFNQTVVSASSDGTVKAWSPHSTSLSDPSIIGLHSDYVRCLAYCRDQNWVASGSFDRTIKLWDLNRTGPAAASDPLITMNSADSAVPKSSVYALATDPFGRTIASGSPERVVRLWDPRNGKRTGKLVGHTDNIRAILLSEDSKYLLTGSADASIKLWSLSSQRCLHTFTHHTDSVWSLFSTHPSLETFYSGDRSGLACRVDIEGCSHLSEGECILLANSSGDSDRSLPEAVNKIVVMDNNLLWAASGTSSIKRWHIPQRRVTRVPTQPCIDTDGDRISIAQSPTLRRLAPKGDLTPESSIRSIGHGKPRRMSSVPSFRSTSSAQLPDRYPDTKLNGIPLESLVKLSSPNDPFTSYPSNRTRDPEVATLYSAASIMSVHQINRPSAQNAFAQSHVSPLHTSRTDETMLPANMARADYEERDIAADAVPICARPDDVLHGDRGLVRSIILNDKIHALTVDTAGEVAVWDIVRATCLGRYTPEDVAAASQSGSLNGENDEQERSPREALEAVRERIEGEAVVSTWCTADTKTGVLTIHLTERCFDAEIYADEVGYSHDRHYDDDSKLNIGKWVLRNLFIGFIREEQQSRQTSSPRNSSEGPIGPSLSRSNSHHKSPSSPESPRKSPMRKASSGVVVYSPKMIPAIIPIISTTVRSSPLLAPLIPLNLHLREPLAALSAIPQSPGSSDATSTPGSHQRSRSGNVDLNSSKNPSSSAKDDYFTARTRQQSIQGGVLSSDDFSGWAGPNKPEPQTPSTPGGIMGRLKNFGGKITKRPVSDIASPLLATPSEVPPSPEGASPEVQQSPIQILLSKTLSPPATIDGPLYYLPQKTVVFIEEEASPSYMTVYRGAVLQTHLDVQLLEEAMPMWLIKYLLFNEIPIPTPLAKLSFVLLPWNKDPECEPLPELLNTTQSRLTAHRNLRVSKLIHHVQDKLEHVMGSGPRQDADNHSQSSRPRGEDLYEILCNDALLPLGMTLAAVRQYVWRQSAELVMHYRRKQRQSPV